MFRLLLASLAALMLALAGLSPTYAQDRQALALTEARRMMEITKAAENTRQMLPAMSKMVGDMIARANPGLDTQVRAAMDELFLPEISARLPAFVDEIALLYTKHFTLEELRQLNTFYSSPVGQKSANVMPQIMQQSMQMGSAWGQAVAMDVLQKLAPKLRERGIKNL